MAAAALMVVGTLAVTSCQKDEVTTGDNTTKAVKGVTMASIEATKVFMSGNNDTVHYSLSDVYDITVEIVAGSDRKTGTLTGNSLKLEAVTTTFPSTGKVTATVTPKQSFLDGIDTTKKYTVFVTMAGGYQCFDKNGESTGGKLYGDAISSQGMRGTAIRKYVTEKWPQIIVKCLGGGTTFEFK